MKRGVFKPICCLVLVASTALSTVPAALGAESGPAAATQSQGGSFDIREYRVIGNTQLSETEIDSVLYDRLGQDKHIEDVEAARAALEGYYRDHGYGAVYVDIPEQRVDAGIVRLHVTEGRLGRVRVIGARYYSNRALLAQLPETEASGTPNFHLLQQEIAQANARTADRQVVPVLRAGATPGTVDLDLNVQDKLPLHGSLELDNRYTVDSEPLRLDASLSYDNLWQQGQSISVQYQTAPQAPHNVQVWAGTYVMHFADGRAALSLYGIDNSSNVSTIGTLSVLGAGDIVGARVTLPFVTTGLAQTLAAGVDYKRFRNNVQVTSSEGVATKISYLNLAVQYDLNEVDSSGALQGSVGLNAGLRGLVGSETQFALDRYGAQPDYLYLRGSLSRSQTLWHGAGAYAEIGGQLSNDPLVSNEQFSAGGVSSVRGYYEAEALGDLGIQTTFELRSPPLSSRGWLSTGTLYAFYDWANLRQHDPLPGQQYIFTLDSAGAGLRLGPVAHVQSGVDWADPLHDGPTTRRGQGRVEFFVRYAR